MRAPWAPAFFGVVVSAGLAFQAGRTIHATGRVLLESGYPPSEPAAIEASCGDSSSQAFTDAEGRFSIRIETGRSGASAAGDLSDAAAAVQENCRVRVSLAGYRPAMVHLPGGRTQEANLGVIVLRRAGGKENATVSMVSLAAPPKAQRAYTKGRRELERGRAEAAAKAFREAVAIHPAYAEAWHHLGLAEEMRKRRAEARAAFERARDADPKYVQPRIRLAWLHIEERNWRAAADAAGEAIKLNPFDFVEAHLFHALAVFYMGDLDAAEKSAREAVRLDPQHRYPKVYDLLARIHAGRRNYAAAAAEMRKYLLYAPDAKDAVLARRDLRRMEILAKGGGPRKRQQTAPPVPSPQP